ncbi:MAG: F0F1 ATP synthase subunit delta [Pseudomonadota bacterium]
MAEQHTLARPYASALFDLADKAGSLDVWGDALQAMAEVTDHADIARLAANPSMDRSSLLGLLRDIASDVPAAAPFTTQGGEGENLLSLLIENGRLSVLPEIAERFKALKDAAQSTVDVVITTAAAMSDAEQQEIARSLTSRLGSNVTIATSIDEDLIGGAVIRAGDFVIDGSVRAQLNRLSSTLAK